LTARPAFYLGDCGSRHPHAGELHHELFGHVQCLGDAGDDLGDVLDLLVRVADGVIAAWTRLTASWYFEEVLRFDSSVITWRRKTTQAVEIGGVPVPADANTVFEDPEHFDIHRQNAKEHLSLGFGAHYCP